MDVRSSILFRCGVKSPVMLVTRCSPLRDSGGLVGRQSGSCDHGSETLIDATFIVDALAVGKS